MGRRSGARDHLRLRERAACSVLSRLTRALVAEIQAVNPQLSAEPAALVVPPSRREVAIDSIRRAGLP